MSYEKWEDVKLGDVLLKIVGGGTPSKDIDNYWNGDIFWCSVKDMKEDSFRLYKTEDTITLDGFKNSSSNLISKNTVITATRMGLGRAFINKVDMAINQDLKALIPSEKIDNEFLLWSIINVKDYIDLLGNGATVKGIRLETLKAIKIKLPPLPTQKKIANILSNYDDLIENNLKQIKLLEEKARLTYEEWFLRFRIDGQKLEIDENTGLPFGWERKEILSICEKFTDGTHDSPKEDMNGIYYLITGKNLVNSTINFKDAYKISEENHKQIIKRSGLKKGDILFSNIGTLGNIAMVTDFHDFSCKNVFIFRPKEFSRYFLFEFLKHPFTQEILISQSSGSTQKFISLQFIRKFKTTLPDDDLLAQYNKKIEPIYITIENLLNQNELLKESRDILLPRLMTGMIDVEKLDIEV